MVLRGYEATKAIWKDKDGNETEEEQVNPEYLFAYNNNDHHKDIYGTKDRKDRNTDRTLTIMLTHYIVSPLEWMRNMKC